MTDTDSSSIALAATLDFPAAADLATKLRDHRRAPITVDASKVQHLGASCLQVLLSAARTWRADSVTLTVDDPSSAFSEGLERMGIAASDLTHPGGSA